MKRKWRKKIGSGEEKNEYEGEKSVKRRNRNKQQESQINPSLQHPTRLSTRGHSQEPRAVQSNISQQSLSALSFFAENYNETDFRYQERLQEII